MKNDRQTAVLQIIEETAVETQEQLMQLLAVRGFRQVGTQLLLQGAGGEPLLRFEAIETPLS